MSLGKRVWRKAFPDRATQLRKVGTDAERLMLHLMYLKPSTATGLVCVDDFTAFAARVPDLRPLLVECVAAELLAWRDGEEWAYIIGTMRDNPPAASNNWKGYRDELRLAPPSFARDFAMQELGDNPFADLHSERGSHGVRTGLEQGSDSVLTKEKKKEQQKEQNKDLPADAGAPDKPTQADLFNEDKPKRTRTVAQNPPTLDEVTAYFADHFPAQAAAVAQDFVNYWTDNGWKRGKTPMVSWKGTAATRAQQLKADPKWLGRFSTSNGIDESWRNDRYYERGQDNA